MGAFGLPTREELKKAMLPEQFRSMEKTMAGEKTYELKEMAPATAAKYGKNPVFYGAIGRFPRALREIAKVSAFGAQKHKVSMGDMSYLTVPSAYEVYTNALSRHLLAEQIEGTVNAQDGGLLHAAQAAWNALARLEVMLRDCGKAQAA